MGRFMPNQGKKIIISGAGLVGRYISEVLGEQGAKITLIDSDERALQKMEESVEARFITGSACHDKVLKQANIDECDLLIAATSMDEVNLLTAVIAKEMGAKNVIARIHDRKFGESYYIDYKKTLGISHIICPEELASKMVCAQILEPGAAAVQHIFGHEFEIYQFVLKKNSSLEGQPLKKMIFPSGIRVMTVKRGDDIIIPSADTQLCDGGVR